MAKSKASLSGAWYVRQIKPIRLKKFTPHYGKEDRPPPKLSAKLTEEQVRAILVLKPGDFALL